MSALYLLLCAACISSLALAEDQCNASTSCDKCIRSRGCSWLLDENASETSRCFFNNGTYRDSIYNPGSSISAVRNEPLSGVALVSPQELKVNLRLYTPVFFYVSLSNNEESLVPPRHQNIVVQYLRQKPEKIMVKIEAVRCPQKAEEYSETLRLHSTVTNQDVVLHLQYICECF